MSQERPPRLPNAGFRVSPGLATFLIAIVVVTCLALAKPVVVPLAFAVLLAFILNPVVMTLARRGVPRVAAVMIVVVATSGIVAGVGWVLTSQVVQFLSQLPEYEGNVFHRINELRAQSEHSVLTRLENFAERVTSAASAPQTTDKKVSEKKTAEPQAVRIVNSDPTVQFGPVVTTVDFIFEFLASAALVAVLVIYLLINREHIRNRALWLFGEGHMTVTTRALDDAAQGLSRFLLVQFLINGSFGVFVGVGLWLIGMPYPMLWGVLSTFLRYIPFVGPWVAMLFPFVLSLAIMTGWTKPALIVALYVAFELAANLAIEPLLYGQSMGVSPAALLIAIAFWSWLWGAAGLVLSVPLTVCLVVLGKHFPSLAFLDILLGDEPVMTTEVQFYQRLLAHDHDEAFEIARHKLEEIPLEKVFDQVIIPTLINARSDFDSGLISAPEAASIFESVREIIGELGTTPKKSGEEVDSPKIESAAVPREKVKVIACAARDTADEAGIEMLSRLLDPRLSQLDIITKDRLVSEIIAQIAAESPSAVCIGALPPGGLSHSRLLCKRLRSSFPDLKLVVGRWGLRPDAETRNRELLREAGADLFATTIEESAQQLVQLQQVIQTGAPPANAQPLRVVVEKPLAASGSGP